MHELASYVVRVQLEENNDKALRGDTGSFRKQKSSSDKGSTRPRQRPWLDRVRLALGNVERP